MSFMRPVLARFRRSTVWGFAAPDALLAAVACVIAVASVLTGNPAEGPLVVTLPVAVVMALALLWRRRMPWLAATLVAASGLVQTLLAQTPGSLWALAISAIVVYSTAAWSTEAVAGITGAGFVAVLLIEEKLASGVDYVFILLLFGSIWLLGRASSYWRSRVTLAEQRQQQAARLAAAEERLRIARDLHDVVAHSLGAIAVQADAAEAALQMAPERAVAPVRAIRDTAREALADIRNVLDVLREEDDPGASHGVGSAGITAMVDAARAAGMRIALQAQGDVDAVPGGIARATYRIVQESLTNARKHSPGAQTAVLIRRRDGVLTVRVVNDGNAHPSTGSGYGIRGMRERVEQLGGMLTAQPTADGGFEVLATLPLTSSTTASSS